MRARTDVSTEPSSLDSVVIHAIQPSDLIPALQQGSSDFLAKPTHGVFLTLIYCLSALFVAMVGLGENLLPLLFPLIGGMALIGPLAACGLYELSRRRERGEDYSWYHVFDVIHAPSRGGIVTMALVLTLLFLSWLMTADLLYLQFFPGSRADSFAAMWEQIFLSSTGWQLLIVGSAIGFVYSLVVYMATVVSLPMMLHHRVSFLSAVGTSLRAVSLNWRAMSLWYVAVVTLVILGALPFFVGLGVVLPILGHATWHLYRRIVAYRH